MFVAQTKTDIDPQYLASYEKQTARAMLRPSYTTQKQATTDEDHILQFHGKSKDDVALEYKSVDVHHEHCLPVQGKTINMDI